MTSPPHSSPRSSSGPCPIRPTGSISHRSDRPFAGFAFGDHRIWEAALVDYIRADLSRRADEKHSADGAVFDALLGVYQVLAHAVVTGRLSAHDRIRELEGRFHGLFSFLASGPPPRRLRELLALHRAGLVRFIGPDTRVTLDAERGQFVGSSPVVAGEIRTTALIDAFLPTIDVSASTDPIVTSLLERGELGAEDLRDAVGAPLGSGSSWPTPAAEQCARTAPCIPAASCSALRCPAPRGRQVLPAPASTAQVSGRTTG